VKKADPIPDGRGMIANNVMELWELRVKARLSRAPYVVPLNLRGPTTHSRGEARQACSVRSERG
jgi:hypothetical protein